MKENAVPRHLREMATIEPTNFLIRLPQLASLVDIDLARLLSIRLAELLSDSQGVDTGLEDASFAAQVCSARKSERGSKIEFSLVQEVSIRVIGEIEDLTLPVCLEDLAVALR